ncbi:MAG: aspartate kinase [Alphaproteobacteria bacterium]|jgi:aspartate kinase
MLIVQKFGGTSVASVEKIKNVAEKVIKEIKAGNKTVVVLSAMSGVTDTLVGFAKEASPLITDASLAEYDVIVSTGENITVGLLALVLQEKGYKARSFLNWEVPILTEGKHSKGLILEINGKTIADALKSGIIPIIPGFQGIDKKTGRITTLGRGGSDTSAVAIAASIRADRCDIYTDVDGVYTTDPRIVKDARKLKKVAYEEMLEMASLGAKVLHKRSVELAMNHGVHLQVLSTFVDELGSNIPGTILVKEDEIMEKRIITGVALDKNEVQITIIGVENIPGVAAKIFVSLAKYEVNVDMIVQNISEKGKKTDITFTVTKDDLSKAKKAIEECDIEHGRILINEDVAKISLIGIGMKTNPGIAAKMFSVLSSIGANILVISTSEIKISVLIEQQYQELALRALHQAFELEKDKK